MWTAGEPAATTLPLSRVAAVTFDPALARVRKPKGPFARLVTADGSRLSLAAATADASTLKGTTTFGTAVEVPLADVIALDVFQGKATYLSDLKPKRATVEGFNGMAWPWAAVQRTSFLLERLTLEGPLDLDAIRAAAASAPATGEGLAEMLDADFDLG